ncbi:PREDICTED: myeloperoxidase-like [Nanorana parkeri]|uniref:myeloperoxidase-like n=1 Tax=Nanorana parkeri TaxID=125878 RepID=UPI0008545D7F|nr:PREDICTED: myeloperoxidase-like [Nanorana parkeri]
MDPQKISAILDWLPPMDRKGVQRFVGFANFYRRFIRDFSKIVLPITQLTRKLSRFQWSQEAQAAFTQLKLQFTSAPILRHPDPELPYVLEVDASEAAVGAVLSQRQGLKSLLHPVAYFSRKLSVAERNYDVGDQELLAIKLALEECKTYPYLHITFRPGSRKGKADALSRIYTAPETLERPETILPATQFLLLQPDLVSHIQQASRISPPSDESGMSQQDGVYFHEDRIFVPSSARTAVLGHCHDAPLAGHFGARKTTDLVRQTFWWPSLATDCLQYVAACPRCARNKGCSSPAWGLLRPLPIPSRLWTAISMDFIVDLLPSECCTAIFVVVDRLFKMAHFVPLQKVPTAEILARTFIREVVCLHGVPTDVVSDIGLQITSKFWKALCTALGIHLSFSSAYHPQTNAEFAYNNARHSTTVQSPFFSNYGFHPACVPTRKLDSAVPAAQKTVDFLHSNVILLQRAISKAQDAAKGAYDRSRRGDLTLQPGDLVWLSTRNLKLACPSRKLGPRYIGPFPVERQMNPASYRLTLPPIYPIHPVFHISILKPVQPDVFSDRSSDIPNPVLIDGEEEYEVEAILDFRRRRGTGQFLIKWKGYGMEENSWEPVSAIHAPRLIRIFLLNNPSKAHLMGARRPPLRGGHVGSRLNAKEVFSAIIGDGYQHSKSGVLKEFGHNLLQDSVVQAKRLVDKAYTDTRNNLKVRLKREIVSPADIMGFFKQPVALSRNRIRAADYMDVTLKLIAEKLKYIYPGPFNISDVLTAEQKEILTELTGCAYKFLPKVCSLSPYRTINAECNNRRNPILGASNTGYKRLLPPEYEDGISLPRGWTENRTINGFPLPKARAVSNQIVSYQKNAQIEDTDRALMFMQWGQFLDHDTDLSPDTPSRSAFIEGVDCDSSCAMAHPCFPLTIPANDPRIKNQSDCIPLFRSAPVCNIVTPLREQINVLTSYVDGSQVYGSDMAVATKLRNTTNNLGLLAVNQNYTDNGQPFLPFTGNNGDLCTRTNTSAGIPCFLAGDARVSEQPGLAMFHTLFLREHNRIVTKLHELNPHWSGERLYQETRKIIGSILQKITYKDWLPLLLGSEMSHVLPAYTYYDDEEDPRVSNVFTIAFRMGHTMVHPLVYRVGDKYKPHQTNPTVPLHQTFFATWRIVNEGGIDPFLRGMLANFAKLNRQNQMVDDELRERLFKMVQRIGLDLAAINIQRGREHGLPGYNAWRRFCGLPAPKNLDELATVLSNKSLAKKLLELYGTPENIDIWIGGVSEPLVPGGRTGKLLACLIGDQFRRTRDGDRFYYENDLVLSPAQKSSIEKVTMSHIICGNTNITEVPLHVFLGNRYPMDFVSCSSIPQLDLSPWKEISEYD